MKIKNFSSNVPPDRSVGHIERSLVNHGAKNIFKNYSSEGMLEGLAFTIDINGKELPFKIPSRISRVEKRLLSGVKRPRNGTVGRIKSQAERTAWKILADWVDIQMTLIDLDQAEMLEVFLPYAYDTGRKQTFFDKVKEGSLKLLTQ